jgi:hypothetical protein
MATGQGPLKGTLAIFFKKLFYRLRSSNEHPSPKTQKVKSFEAYKLESAIFRIIHMRVFGKLISLQFC